MPDDAPKPHDWSADIAASYDRVAGPYAAEYFDELSRKPFDRELLTRFARGLPEGARVCDIGCGPGHIARYLAGEGLDPIGVDLSAAMVETARRLNPGLHFVQSDMLQLPFADHWFAGLTAFYSMIHIERSILPQALAELYRVLAPGGRVLLTFHAGEGELHLDELFGETVVFHITFFSSPEMARAVGEAGFQVEESVEREPYEFEYQSRRAYINAYRPQ